MMTPPRDFSNIHTLFADIDDTISTDGHVTRQAFGALWEAHDRGLRIIPVTGRPAGWCDHIARMWPVPAVIGENGGFYFRRVADGMQRVYAQDAATRATHRKRLDQIREEVMRTIPGAAVAADQPYRELDLAIDFCEDVDPLPLETAQRIAAVFKGHGATARISSIHVNGWFGEFNKLSMTRQFVQAVDGVDLDAARDHYAFIGDSANDEPMFAYFHHSFGVSNVRRFLPMMAHAPRHIAASAAGDGFVETVHHLLNAHPGKISK